MEHVHNYSFNLFTAAISSIALFHAKLHLSMTHESCKINYFSFNARFHWCPSKCPSHHHLPSIRFFYYSSPIRNYLTLKTQLFNLKTKSLICVVYSLQWKSKQIKTVHYMYNLGATRADNKCVKRSLQKHFSVNISFKYHAWASPVGYTISSFISMFCVILVNCFILISIPAC